MKEVAMSVVDVVAVSTSRHEDQLDITPFGASPAAHHVAYVYIALEPCEGSERIPSLSGDRIMRLARHGNRLVWRDKDGATLWIVVAERTLVNPVTGEQSVLETSESVQIGDRIHVDEGPMYEGRSRRRRLMGRVKHVSTCV